MKAFYLNKFKHLILLDEIFTLEFTFKHGKRMADRSPALNLVSQNVLHRRAHTPRIHSNYVHTNFLNLKLQNFRIKYRELLLDVRTLFAHKHSHNTCVHIHSLTYLHIIYVLRRKPSEKDTTRCRFASHIVSLCVLKSVSNASIPL